MVLTLAHKGQAVHSQLRLPLQLLQHWHCAYPSSQGPRGAQPAAFSVAAPAALAVTCRCACQLQNTTMNTGLFRTTLVQVGSACMSQACMPQDTKHNKRQWKQHGAPIVLIMCAHATERACNTKHSKSGGSNTGLHSALIFFPFLPSRLASPFCCSVRMHRHGRAISKTTDTTAYYSALLKAHPAKLLYLKLSPVSF